MILKAEVPKKERIEKRNRGTKCTNVPERH